MNPPVRSLAFLVCVAFAAPLAGCAGGGEAPGARIDPRKVVRDWRPDPSEVEKHPGAGRTSIGRLAVFPTFAVVGESSESLGCDLCVQHHKGGANPPGARAWLDEKLYDMLPAGYQNTAVPRDVVAGAVRAKGIDLSGPAAPPTEALLEVARVAHADTLLLAFLFRYREREGTNYGVHDPASVAFELVMVAADDGELLWRAAFDETQESLSENLLKLDRFIQNRGQWVPAATLAEHGLSVLIRRLPPAGGTADAGGGA